jgi:hypothetical protein
MRLAVTLLASLTVAGLAGCVDPAAGGGSTTEDGAVEVTDLDGAPSLDDKADANDLTTAKQKIALKVIDDICGDTWCEGDFDFGFKKIVCHFGKGTCTVTMLIWPRQDTRPIPTYWRSCKISGLHGFADLVDTAPSGYQSIDQAFYDKMTTCTMKITDRLPPAQG